MLRFFDRLNLTPSERRLVVGIAAIAFVVLNYWLVWPRFGDFREITERMEDTATKGEMYQREIARRPVYEAMLAKLQASGSALPVGEERIQFRSEMERLAREVGLMVPRWSDVQPERGGTTNAFFEAIALTMTQVTGTEAQFVEFLYRVGSSSSTIRVKDLTLAPGSFDARSQGNTNLVGTIRLVASVQKASATGPVTATPSPAATGVPAANPPGATAANAAPGSPHPRTNTIPSPVRTVGRTNLPSGS
ncbi:MAG: hypothetical protein KF833_22570 [Verrucomicrobiae bacterium]|nr:hypothetical protein [Verrucomicrobiae bacterium]